MYRPSPDRMLAKENPLVDAAPVAGWIEGCFEGAVGVAVASIELPSEEISVLVVVELLNNEKYADGLGA